MSVRVRGVVFWVLFVVAAACVSVPLAALSEDVGYLYGTPGLFLARRLTASESGFAGLGKQILIAGAVDASICFLVICGTGIAISMFRRRRNP
jgi:hypothetical protein